MVRWEFFCVVMVIKGSFLVDGSTDNSAVGNTAEDGTVGAEDGTVGAEDGSAVVSEIAVVGDGAVGETGDDGRGVGGDHRGGAVVGVGGGVDVRLLDDLVHGVDLV